MHEEWRVKGELLQELNALRSRIAQLEQSEHSMKREKYKNPEETFRFFFR